MDAQLFGPADRRQDKHVAPLLLVCGCTILLRLIVVWYMAAHYSAATIYGGFETAGVGAAIVRGQGFSSLYGIPSGPTAWLAPLYPLIVAAAFKLFGLYSMKAAWCLYFFNILCATLTTALLYRIGLRFFGPVIAFAGSLLWAGEFAIAVYAARIWDSSLSALIATAAVAWYLRLVELRSSRLEWVAYGLFWAVAALVNTALLALMPLGVILLLYKNWREVRWNALAALLVFICALLPWTVRNYTDFHKIIPIRGNFGPNLWYGNHPGVTGPDDESLDPTQNSQELAEYLQLGDAGYAASRQRMAVEFIRAHPLQFVQLTWSRVLFYWSGGRGWARLLAAGWSILAFAGLLLVMRQHSLLQTAPFVSSLLLYPLPNYLTHTEGFYRHPIEPVITLLGIYSCFVLAEALISGPWFVRRLRPRPST